MLAMFLTALVSMSGAQASKLPLDCPTTFCIFPYLQKYASSGLPGNARIDWKGKIQYKRLDWDEERKVFHINLLSTNEAYGPSTDGGVAPLVGAVTIEGRPFTEFIVGDEHLAVDTSWVSYNNHFLYVRRQGRWERTNETTIWYERRNRVGEPFQLPLLHLMRGGTVSAKSLLGHYAIVVIFGHAQADWFWGCTALSVQHLSDTWGKRGVKVLGLFAVDQPQGRMRPPINMTAEQATADLKENYAEQAKQYGRPLVPTAKFAFAPYETGQAPLRISGQPNSFIVDPQGRIVFYLGGWVRGTNPEGPDYYYDLLGKELKKILAARK